MKKTNFENAVKSFICKAADSINFPVLDNGDYIDMIDARVNGMINVLLLSTKQYSAYLDIDEEEEDKNEQKKTNKETKEDSDFLKNLLVNVFGNDTYLSINEIRERIQKETSLSVKSVNDLIRKSYLRRYIFKCPEGYYLTSAETEFETEPIF